MRFKRKTEKKTDLIKYVRDVINRPLKTPTEPSYTPIQPSSTPTQSSYTPILKTYQHNPIKEEGAIHFITKEIGEGPIIHVLLDITKQCIVYYVDSCVMPGGWEGGKYPTPGPLGVRASGTEHTTFKSDKVQ